MAEDYRAVRAGRLAARLTAGPLLPAVDALRRGLAKVFKDTRIPEEATNRLGALLVKAELAVIENQFNDAAPEQGAMPHVPLDSASAN